MNHRNHRLLKALVLLAAAVALAGPCAVWGQDASSQNGIAKEVRHELVTLPFYTVFDNLNCRVDGGTVTLLGQVVRAALKTDAEKAVRQIAGVRSVNNEIEVLPISPVNGKLRLRNTWLSFKIHC